MTMATETESAPQPDIKDVKDLKDALKDDATTDNKEKSKKETETESAKDDKKDDKAENKQKSDDPSVETATTEGKQAGKAESPAAAAPAAPKIPPVHKQDFAKDIIYLYQFPRTPLIPSLSPYCLKVETWLRLNGVKYENVDHKVKFRSKKGQLPFIEVNGEEIADSTIILRELGQKLNKDIDACLTPEQKNVSHATTSMIENHLVWVVAHWRTKNLDQMIKGYKINLQHTLGTRIIPNPVLNFFFKYTFGRKLDWLQGAKKVKAQGMGVHTQEEVMKFGCDDLKVLSDILADKPFFFGDEPTMIDIVAFANLSQILYLDKEIPFPLRDYMQENCPNLVGHCSRMKERCFPDWDDICSSLDMNTHLPKPEKTEETKEGKEDTKETKESKEEKEGDKEKADKEEKDVEKDKEDEKKEKDKEGK